jgi:hypothetical protein
VDLPASLVERARDSMRKYRGQFVPAASTVEDLTGTRYLAFAAPVYVDEKPYYEFPRFVVVELYSLKPLEDELAK